MNTQIYDLAAGDKSMGDYSWEISDSDLATPTETPASSTARAHSAPPQRRQLPRLPDLSTALPSLLRGVGAAVVVAAISALLFQNWDAADDLQRYLLLLLHTVGLGVGGFAIGSLLHEAKGARLLVMLAVASIPVNFTILGALIYGHLGQSLAVDGLPAVALWQFASSMNLSLVVAGSATVLALIALVGFRVLARHSTLRLSGLYLLLNAALLVPTRETALVSLLLLTLLMIACVGVQRLRAADTTLATPEGWIARLVQFIPVSILLGRQVWLYQADTFMLVAISLGAFLVLRLIGQRLAARSNWRYGIELLSLIPAVGVSSGVTLLVNDESLLGLTLSLPFALLCVEVSLRSADGYIFRRLAATALALGGLIGLLLVGDMTNALISLLLGLVVMGYAYTSHQSLIFLLGVLAFLGGLMLQLARIGDLVDFSHWGTLAAIGVLAIVSGSVLERHGARIYQRLAGWRQGLDGWNG